MKFDNYLPLLRRALQEDMGEGDHSAEACIAGDARGRAFIICREAGIAAGLHLAELTFKELDPGMNIRHLCGEGQSISAGMEIMEISGKSRAILSGERTALNFMQRLSGIATTTSMYVKAVEGTPCRILDTRKTTPGLRALEKWAVRTGGGENHRMGLYDMIMLKDNHIDYAGGIGPAVLRAKKYLEKKRLSLDIEVETRSLKEVGEALKAEVDYIMLDNFTPEEVKKAVELIHGRCFAEASGGITLDTVRSYAETGVDFISSGSLTHSYKSLDISLKAEI